MKRYEVSFLSANTQACTKPITAMVCEPDQMTPDTGVLLTSHGWGGNRYADLRKIEHVCDAQNLVGVSVEYRQSGFDYDPFRGSGWDCPYDLSFYQLFDVLNGLREVLTLRAGLNLRRLFHYGGSQGGHLALLSAIVAPKTFAAVYASCGATFVEPHFLVWAGREFFPFELSFRNVIEHADRILCPVYLDHGTADVEVSHLHSQKLEQKLRELGRTVDAKYYEGGGHQLEPISDRLSAFKLTAPRFLAGSNPLEPEILGGGVIELPCADRTLVVDWSRRSSDAELFSWRM